MSESLTIDFARPIPVFPLPTCALLPHATVPLHIFERRYRQMTREALDSHGLIAMAMFKGAQWQENYQGDPPIRDHVCVGYIVQHQKLDDGRYNILLQGVCRARVVREVDNEKRSYRLAELEPTEDETPMEIDLDERRERIEALLERPRLKQLAMISSIHQWLSREVPTSAIVDLTILITCHDAEQRYAMLAEPSVDHRADWLEHYLRELDQLLVTAERFEPATSDDGIPLN